jgi:hypothetical protein
VNLTKLAIKYSSDKYYNHSYVGFYQELFAKHSIKRLLEIGIGYESLMRPFLPLDVPYIHGSSLYMWRDAFPNAEIFGCDIREETLFQEGNIKTFPCDQTSVDDLQRLMVKIGDPCDVIIDDGSHEIESQIFTAQCLLPFVAEGGVYVTEDCRDPEQLVAALHSGEIHRFDKRPDDTLVVFHR